MIAMQYTIQLAADFSADKIRERVTARYPLFDHYPGLAHKSYLFNHPLLSSAGSGLHLSPKA